MGKDGSAWHHGWVPANMAAVRLKLHQAPAGGQRQQRLKDVKPTPGSHLPLPPSLSGKRAAPKAAAPKTAKPRAPRTAAKPKKPDPIAELLKAARPQPSAIRYPAASSTEQQVHEAVRSAAASATGLYSGSSVTVADARATAERAGVSAADFDQALMRLHDKGSLHVTSSNASNLLTPKQRAGGIRFGGTSNQVIRLS